MCKDALDELRQDQKLLEEKHNNDSKALEQKYQSHLLEVENELKHCKAELKGLKEKNISNEKDGGRHAISLIRILFLLYNLLCYIFYSILISYIISHRTLKNLRCIVFVERVITAVVLEYLLNEILSKHNDWKSKYIVGN